MGTCRQNTGSWIATLMLVGAGIWAIPLIWYSKQKKKDKA